MVSSHSLSIFIAHRINAINEEDSIGGARPQEIRRVGKVLGRALPIEFVELSRTESYGY